MLVIVNGALKSGSTWMFEIVKAITGYSRVPQKYLNPTWTLPDWRENTHGEVWAINPRRLKNLLNGLDYASNNYIAKNHFGKQHEKELILSHNFVRTLNITRDIRDVLVSAYHHDCRIYRYKGDFKQYYWTLGRLRAFSAISHNRLWENSGQSVYVSSFERLKRDFYKEVNTLGHFVGKDLTVEDVERIRRETDLVQMRKKWGETNKEISFFRKGIIGDWRNYFDLEMLSDVEELGEKGPTRLKQWVIGMKTLKFIPSKVIFDKTIEKLRTKCQSDKVRSR